MKKKIGSICLCLIMVLEIVMHYPLEEVRADLTPIHSGTICLFVGEEFTATMDTSKSHYLLNGLTEKEYNNFSVKLSGINNSKITIQAKNATDGTPSSVRIYDKKSSPTKEYYAIAVAVLATPPTPVVSTPASSCWKDGVVGLSTTITPAYKPQKCSKSNCSCIIGNISDWKYSYNWQATNCTMSPYAGANCTVVSSGLGQASVALTVACTSSNTNGVAKNASTVMKQWNVYEKPYFVSKPAQDVYIWRGEKENIQIDAAATTGLLVSNTLSSGDLNGATAVYSNGYLVVDTTNCQGGTEFVVEICLSSSAGGSLEQVKSNIQIHVYDKPDIDSWEVDGETNKASVIMYENESINVTMHTSGTVNAYVWKLSEESAFSCIEQGTTNTLTALRAGRYTLMMQAQANSYKTGLSNCTSVEKIIDIQVLKKPDITIGFDKSDQVITLEEGDNTRRIKAILSPADATARNVIYSSSDSSIVTVDSTGKLTAVGAGVATITAQLEDNSEVRATSIIYVKKKKPTNISVKDVNGLPVISWSGVDGGSMYSVWRKDGYGDYKKIADARTLKYTDTSVKYGVSYTYAVKTVWEENDEFDSVLSDAVAYKRILPSPQKVATTNKSKYVEISWNKIANATSYKVYRSTIKNGEYVAIGKAETNKYCDTKAVYGKKYYYKVTAVVGNDESARSSAVLADYKPGKPVIKSISAQNGTMKISMKKAYYDGCSVYVGKSKKNKKYVGSFTKKAATIRYSKYKGKYSVWIKTYKKVNGKKVYSDYSKPKKVNFK